MTKGEGCVDKPVEALWNNFVRHGKIGATMELVVGPYGLRASIPGGPVERKPTEYFANRLAFCTTSTKHSRLFVWVYRHEGKKGKAELRCHAAFCRRAEDAARLKDKLKANLARVLREYAREQRRRETQKLDRRQRCFGGGGGGG